MRVVAAPSAPMPGSAIGRRRPPSGNGLRFGFRGCRLRFCRLAWRLRFSFSRYVRFAFRLLFRGLGNRSRNFRRLGGAESRGAFLGLSLPIAAAKALSGGEIPPAGIGVIPNGFQIARQFERNHGVASFGEKIRQLCRGVFSGACSADSRGNLLPVGHTVKAF